ncbi:MAG: 3'-5' exonuclease, partial [bacterium]
MSFIGVFYDSYRNTLYHKWIDETGKRRVEKFSPKYEYYIEDKTGKSEIKDIYGTSVVHQETDSRDGLKSIVLSGVKCYEHDIPQDLKFLQKKYGNKKLDVNIDNFQIAFIDIEVASPKEFPKPEEAKFPINLITVYFSKQKQSVTFGNKEYTGDSDLVKNFVCIPDEKRFLEKFLMILRKQKVDIVTGWNSTMFDIPYIINRCRNLGIDYTKFSTFNIVNKKRNHEEYIIAGIAQYDYLELYKRFRYKNQESYSLNNVAKDELNESKFDYEGTINNAWEKNWNEFVEYNVQDVELVRKFEDTFRFIELAITICYQALIPFDSIFSTLPMHVGYILKFLHNKKMVMPARQDSESEEYPGAYVYATPGMYKNIMSYDVESEYPHMIMQFNIGPETLRKDPKNTDGLI